MKKQYINGKYCDAVNGGVWNVINPATEEIMTTVPFGDDQDCLLAIDAATHAFTTWKKISPWTRADILRKAADNIRKNISLFAEDMVMESGKPLAEAKGELTVAANLFEWYAEEAKRGYGKVIPSSRTDKRMQVIYQPMGVIGVITAWNFPAYNPARAWAAALAAGCTLVVKVSEFTPLTGMNLIAALIEAGLPAGVINLVHGDAAKIGAAMLNHSAVKKISFTGSTRVGKILMDGASKTNTKLALELGGNAPVIILDDVDIEHVAKTAATTKFRNCGQVCISPQRFYVHEKIFEEFSALVANYAAALTVGNGNFVLPTVIEVTNKQSEFIHKEIFGPVMPLIPFSTIEEVITLANQTPYGLSAYIWTNNINHAIYLSEALEFGMVGINEWAPHATEAPFGGWKQSGIGHESGSEGMMEYMEKKLIAIGGL